MLSERLRKLRKDHKITQVNLANSLNLDKSSIAKYETSSAMPSQEVLVRIADFFGVSVDYLLGRETGVAGERPEPTRPGSKWIPVLGQVVAGMPLEAVEEILDWEEIDAKTAANGEHFALKVKGDSMEPALLAGDVIIVRKQPTADNNNVVVALVNGDEATIKRLKKRPDGLMLIPNNPAYEPMFFSNKEIETLPVEILGVAIEIRRALLL